MTVESGRDRDTRADHVTEKEGIKAHARAEWGTGVPERGTSKEEESGASIGSVRIVLLIGRKNAKVKRPSEDLASRRTSACVRKCKRIRREVSACRLYGKSEKVEGWFRCEDNA